MLSNKKRKTSGEGRVDLTRIDGRSSTDRFEERIQVKNIDPVIHLDSYFGGFSKVLWDYRMNDHVH